MAGKSTRTKYILFYVVIYEFSQRAGMQHNRHKVFTTTGLCYERFAEDSGGKYVFLHFRQFCNKSVCQRKVWIVWFDICYFHTMFMPDWIHTFVLHPGKLFPPGCLLLKKSSSGRFSEMRERGFKFLCWQLFALCIHTESTEAVL